jgi:hypothetical protein
MFLFYNYVRWFLFYSIQNQNGNFLAFIKLLNDIVKLNRFNYTFFILREKYYTSSVEFAPLAHARFLCY